MQLKGLYLSNQKFRQLPKKAELFAIYFAAANAYENFNFATNATIILIK